MRKLCVASGVLILVAATSLHLPGTPRLELYDVQDLTYCLGGWSVDISLAGSKPDPILEVNLIMLGSDLADRLRPLAPTSDVPVQFQNGLLIVRGTAPQQLGVRAALAVLRIRNAAVTRALDAASHAKAALSAALFGMITR